MTAHQPLSLEIEDLLGTTVGPTGLSLPDSASSRCSPNTQVFFPHLLQVFTERTSFTETSLDHSALKPARQSLNLSLPQSPPRLCKEQLPSSICESRICSPLLLPLSDPWQSPDGPALRCAQNPLLLPAFLQANVAMSPSYLPPVPLPFPPLTILKDESPSVCLSPGKPALTPHTWVWCSCPSLLWYFLHSLAC